MVGEHRRRQRTTLHTKARDDGQGDRDRTSSKPRNIVDIGYFELSIMIGCGHYSSNAFFEPQNYNKAITS